METSQSALRNVTVEIPLKAITAGYFWKVPAIVWRNRRTCTAKSRTQEMGGRSSFIWLYL
jgi:hypothetical protein